MKNPLDTPEMRAEIQQLHKNVQKRPVDVDKIMRWVRGEGHYKSPTATLIEQQRKQQQIGNPNFKL